MTMRLESYNMRRLTIEAIDQLSLIDKVLWLNGEISNVTVKKIFQDSIPESDIRKFKDSFEQNLKKNKDIIKKLQPAITGGNEMTAANLFLGIFILSCVAIGISVVCLKSKHKICNNTTEKTNIVPSFPIPGAVRVSVYDDALQNFFFQNCRSNYDSKNKEIWLDPKVCQTMLMYNQWNRTNIDQIIRNSNNQLEVYSPEIGSVFDIRTMKAINTNIPAAQCVVCNVIAEGLKASGGEIFFMPRVEIKEA